MRDELSTWKCWKIFFLDLSGLKQGIKVLIKDKRMMMFIGKGKHGISI